MRESYAYVILERKTKRLRNETGNPDLRSILDTGRDPKELFKTAIVRPIKMLLFSPIVFLMSLYMALVYGYLYLMFTTFPRVFQGQYGFSNASVGFVYLGIGVGSFFGLVFCAAISDRLVKSLTKRSGGSPKPEYRLPAIFIGALVIPLGLFLYGWSAEKEVHWIVPIIGTAFLGGGMFLVFVSYFALECIGEMQLNPNRCRRSPTSLMLILFMQLLCPLQPRFFALFLERYFRLLETACMMHLESVGAHHFWVSSQSHSFQCLLSSGSLAKEFEIAGSPKSNYDDN